MPFWALKRARIIDQTGQEEQNKIEAPGPFLTPVACQKGALIMNPLVIEKIRIFRVTYSVLRVGYYYMLR